MPKQTLRGNPNCHSPLWIPAFAGMTDSGGNPLPPQRVVEAEVGA